MFSDDGRYRYLLTRDADQRSPVWKERVCWILLNPSTASEDQDDPTIRRCVRFAWGWGFMGVDIVNLFGFRATRPKELYRMTLEAAQGPSNKTHVLSAVAGARMVVCGWGVHGALYEQGLEVRMWMRRAGFLPSHLGLTKGGQPRHPLYLKGDLKPEVWKE